MAAQRPLGSLTFYDSENTAFRREDVLHPGQFSRVAFTNKLKSRANSPTRAAIVPAASARCGGEMRVSVVSGTVIDNRMQTEAAI